MRTLVIGYGNPARGDDGLGPLLTERLARQARKSPRWGDVRCLVEFQLQVEHALDLIGSDRVLFVDASYNCVAPFELTPVAVAPKLPRSTHAIRPTELLRVYAEIERRSAPEAWLLAIQGRCFDLGEPLSDAAIRNLRAAWKGARRFLASGV